jgi:hypothetical protein
VHHLLQHRERRDGPVADRPEAVEQLLCPHQHSLAALLGQPNQVGHHAHRKVVRQLGRGVEAALGDQPLDHVLGLRGDLISHRPQCPRCQRTAKHIAQRVVLGSIAAQGVAAQHLVHPVVHHHAVARHEGVPVLQRTPNRVVAGEGEHLILRQPHGRTGTAQLPVPRPRIEQRFIGVGIVNRPRSRADHNTPVRRGHAFRSAAVPGRSRACTGSILKFHSGEVK